VHIPVRTCRACGRKAGKNELARWAAANGEIVADSGGNLPGRGVYCCKGGECAARLLKNEKKLHKLLRLKG
jgi:hypothetical protein